MATYLSVIAFSIGFVELFLLLRAHAVAASIVGLSRESMRVLTSANMDDNEKEKITRQFFGEITKATLRLAAQFLVIAAALYVPYMLIDRYFPWLTLEMGESVTSPSVIAISTASVICYAFLRRGILRRT